jgi:hypothetical protein
MKNIKILAPLFTSLLLGSVALAQAGSPTLPDAPQPQDSTSTLIENTTGANTATSDGGKLITQARPHPRFPRRPMRPDHGRAYRSAAPMPRLSPVGALIGFGFGAALGASRSQDTTAGGRAASGVLLGAICALIGGAIGDASHHFQPVRNHPPSDPGDDDDSDLSADVGKTRSTPSVSARPAAPSQSTRVETPAQASLEVPAVP